MLTQTLYDTVRRELKDVQSPTVIGEFWDDRAINLALNASVNMLVNLWLYTKNTDMLSYLYSFIDYPPLATFGTPNLLPTDYLHYISATVGEESRVAKLYIGAEVDDYYDVRHCGAFIRRTGIVFSDDGNMEASGRLYYYKQPIIIPFKATPVPATDSFNEDFPREVYIDIICKEAAFLLAYKETPTQRELKSLFANMKTIGLYPKSFASYRNDRDAIASNKPMKDTNQDG